MIGFTEKFEEPEWVMDILAFRVMSGQESLELAQCRKWKFYSSLAHYAASFHEDAELGLKIVKEAFGATHPFVSGVLK